VAVELSSSCGGGFGRAVSFKLFYEQATLLFLELFGGCNAGNLDLPVNKLDTTVRERSLDLHATYLSVLNSLNPFAFFVLVFKTSFKTCIARFSLKKKRITVKQP
jgi:hypothetical protein